jgi:type IV secretion system protein VirB10
MADPQFNGYAPPEDVTGTGAGIALQQAPKRLGVRFSKRSKLIVVGFAAVMLGMILYGIMQAGQRNAQVQAPASDDAPGQQHPDFSGMRGNPSAAVPAVPATAASPAAGAATGPNDCEHRNNSPWPCAPGRPGVAGATSPEQKYRQWAIEQQYKELEDGVMARHAAIQSEVKLQNVQIASNAARRDGAQAGNSSATGALMNDLAGRLNDAASAAGSSGGGVAALAKLQGDYLKSLAGNGANGNASGTGNKGGVDANQAWQQDAGSSRNAGGYLAATRQPARGGHELFAGSIIPAVMVTAIDSDLPGTITASVRRTVYDSRDPSVVLVPQDTKLIGQYNSMVQYGQKRLMVAWNELIYPDGSKLDLKGMSGTDSLGQAGFADLVDNHYFRVFGSSVLISLFGTAAQLSQPQNASALTTPSAASQATGNFATAMDTTAVNILNKNLNIAPTLNIRPGYPFNVLVSKSIALQAWIPN